MSCSAPRSLNKQLNKISNSGWMGTNAEQLGRLSLKSLVLPGTHDAGSFAITDKSALATEGRQIFEGFQSLRSVFGSLIEHRMHSIMAGWVVTQNCSIFEQLRAGARYLDLRCGFHDGQPYIHHAKFSVPLRQVCEEIRQFVETEGFDKEVVVVELSHLEFDDEQQAEENTRVYTQILGDLCLCNDRFDACSSLEQIWQTNQRIVTLHENGAQLGLNYLWDTKTFMDYQWIKQSDLHKLHDGLTGCIETRALALRQHSDSAKRLLLITTARDTTEISLLKYVFSDLKKFAGEQTQKNVEWMKEWERAFPGTLNIFSVDFIQHSQVVDVAVHINLDRARLLASSIEFPADQTADQAPLND